jgi:dihydrofolate reductase
MDKYVSPFRVYVKEIALRKLIAALQTSLDGFIEGPNGELDWAMADDKETWSEMDETLNSVDIIILGRKCR